MSADANGGQNVRTHEVEQNWLVLKTTAAGIAGITTWGVLEWDYFSRTPHAQSEAWFRADTGYGGMDKLGHLYSSYAVTHGIAYLYEHWDFNHEAAARYGALTTFVLMGYMEFGDSFSSYGFSGEDMVFNILGTAAGYWLYVCPELASKIDLRWQFGLEPNQMDFLTDYDNSKFLLALKLNGFETFQNSWLKHVELHVGYYTEGFEERTKSNRRHPYVGLGFNLTDLFRRHGYTKTATFFNYVQLPYTSFNHDFDL